MRDPKPVLEREESMACLFLRGMVPTRCRSADSRIGRLQEMGSCTGNAGEVGGPEFRLLSPEWAGRSRRQCIKQSVAIRVGERRVLADLLASERAGWLGAEGSDLCQHRTGAVGSWPPGVVA